MQIPTGKGNYLWIARRIKELYGGLDNAARAFKQAGFSFVVPKVADGPWNYNMRWAPEVNKWIDDLMPEFVAAFRAEGIGVHGFQYLYGYSPEAEADRAIARVKNLGLDALWLDPEGEYKGKYSQARIYSRRLRDGLPDTPIGLSSYRYPDLHNSLPWAEFLEICDFHAPQVYWVQAHNPAAQLRKSVEQLRKRKDLPFIPVGSAYSEFGWKPTVDELNEFNAAVIADGHQGINWWEWYEQEVNNFFPTLAAHQWAGSTPPPHQTWEQAIDAWARSQGFDGPPPPGA